jgi:mannose-1-phosphate guanylyltransferase
MSAARGASSGDALYTFGIAPTHPATGYGYLEVGATQGSADDVEHFALQRFVEKPDATRAASYVESGRFLWNSGMFVWRTSAILRELARNLPAHLDALAGAVAADRTPGFGDALATSFQALARVSIDVAVMEKAQTIRCVRAQFDWSDVGGFPALLDHLPKDAAGNAHRGQVVAHDSRDNLVFADDDTELIALIGVENLIVVRAGKRTLVVPRSRAEEIKALVAKLPRDVI